MFGWYSMDQFIRAVYAALYFSKNIVCVCSSRIDRPTHICLSLVHLLQSILMLANHLPRKKKKPKTVILVFSVFLTLLTIILAVSTVCIHSIAYQEQPIAVNLRLLFRVKRGCFSIQVLPNTYYEEVLLKCTVFLHCFFAGSLE